MDREENSVCGFQPVDEVHLSEEELLDFEESITKLEKNRVGATDGVFKILIPVSEQVAPVDAVLRLLGNEDFGVSRQTVIRGKGSNIHHYKRLNASPTGTATFKSQAKNISSYSKETCCSQHLKLSCDALLLHFFQDVIANGPHIKDSVRGSFDAKEKDHMLLKQAVKTQSRYRNMKEGRIPIFPKVEASSCTCIDCFDEPETETDKDSDDDNNDLCQEKCEEPILYGDGLVLRKSATPILITEKFGFSKIFSILNLLKTSYKGLHSTYYYIGSNHSFFPLHIEDASLWSINHLITGQPKIWIVIPPKALMLLEYQLRWSGLSVGNTSCNNFLLHKTALPTPVWLRERGIPFKVVVQKPGECVVLYPTAAHFGFNTGWNLAQAINFATVSWIPFGANAPRCLCLKNQIHLDLSEIMAAFRPDILGPYLRAEPITSPNLEQMTQMLTTVLKNSPVDIQSSQTNRKPLVQHKNGSKKDISSTIRRLLECPALFCPKKYPLDKRKRLINHIIKKHKPIKEKLLSKINEKLRLHNEVE